MAGTNETTAIARLIRESYSGPVWHGPSLIDQLKGFTPAEAFNSSISGSHTAWELVLHLTAWLQAVTNYLYTGVYEGLDGERDWPPVADAAEAQWDAAIAGLEHATVECADAVDHLDSSRLIETIRTGVPISLHTVLHGIVNHAAYHSGQLAFLRKR